MTQRSRFPREAWVPLLAGLFWLWHSPEHGFEPGGVLAVPILVELRGTFSESEENLLVEVHVDPSSALSDGHQSLSVAAFDELMPSLQTVAAAVNRSGLEPVR